MKVFIIRIRLVDQISFGDNNDPSIDPGSLRMDNDPQIDQCNFNFDPKVDHSNSAIFLIQNKKRPLNSYVSYSWSFLGAFGCFGKIKGSTFELGARIEAGASLKCTAFSLGNQG